VEELSRNKEGCALQRNKDIAEWMTENKRRPSRKGKNASREEKKMGKWYDYKLQRIREGKCTGDEDEFAPLRKCDCWNQAVEGLSRNKEGCALQRNKDIAEWMTENKRRPSRKGKNASREEKRMGKWYDYKLQRIREGKCTGDEDEFAPLRKCDCWNQAVEGLSRKKKQSPIEGWDDMTPLERNERAAQWSQENERRPSTRGKNASPEERTLGRWWDDQLRRIIDGKCTGEEDDFAPLRKCDYWKQAVEGLSRKKKQSKEKNNRPLKDGMT
jgi:hypothetical protein